jgi:hypothetical protein
MFSKELLELLVLVITPREVIGVTVVLILYLLLVFYVARPYHPPRAASPPGKKPKKSAPPPGPDIVADDDLGLEEGSLLPRLNPRILFQNLGAFFAAQRPQKTGLSGAPRRQP